MSNMDNNRDYLDSERENESEIIEGQSVPVNPQDEEGKDGAASHESSSQNYQTNQHVSGMDSDSGSTIHPDQDPASYSAVAMAAKRKKLVIAALVAMVVVALYFSFFSGEKGGKSAREIQREKDQLLNQAIPSIGTTNRDGDIGGVVITQAPELTAPTPPAPPPAPAPTVPSTPFLNDSGRGSSQPGPVNLGSSGTIFGSSSQSDATVEDQQRLLARRSESIIVLGGGGGAGFGTGSSAKPGEEGKEGEESNNKTTEKKDNSGFLGFGEGQLRGTTIRATSSEQVRAATIGDLNNTVAQGKLINAVLETAINTDVPGMLRAVISRDVYAEAGRRILIPKGSRAIGVYDSDVINGQTRVNVMWNRIIMPNGLDIAVGSPGTDQLGRAGIAGDLDNKFFTRMASAFLVSFLIPLAAFELSGAEDSDTTTTTTTSPNGDVSTSSTGSIKSQLAKDSADKFSDVASEIVKSTFKEKPTIRINQGERVNIFVNKDLVFPPQSVLNNMQTVQ